MSNRLKLKVRTKIPAALLEGTGVGITKDGLSYTIGLDYSGIQETDTFDPNFVEVAIWNPHTGDWARVSLTDFVNGSFSFIQAGTGAVTRTMQNKARDIFSALDFGAVGDGTTDDSTKLQAALDAIATIGNGALYLPGGHNFKAVGLTWGGVSKLRIYGDGPASILSIANTTGTLFTATDGIIDIDGLTVQHPTHDASTAGLFFKFSCAGIASSRSTVATLNNIKFINGFNVAQWSDGCNICGATNIYAFGVKNDLFQVDVSPTAPAAQQFGNIIFNNINAQAFPTNAGSGLRLTSGDGIFVSNSNIAGFKNIVSGVGSASRSYLANLFFSNVSADGAGGPASTNPAWFFDGTLGPVLRVYLSNCAGSAMGGGRGASFKNTKNIQWKGGCVIGNGLEGIVLDTGANEVLIEGVVISGNSQSSSNTSDGILIVSGANDIRIKNCRIGATYNGTDSVTLTNSQRWGINISNASVTNYELIGNNVTANTTGGITDSGGSGGSRLVKDNIGYNPLGMSSITLGASPATYTAGATPETVFIAGGTVSGITVSGTAVCGALSGGPAATIQLNPNQSMVVTYSSAPTITVKNRQ